MGSEEPKKYNFYHDSPDLHSPVIQNRLLTDGGAVNKETHFKVIFPYFSQLLVLRKPLLMLQVEALKLEQIFPQMAGRL